LVNKFKGQLYNKFMVFYCLKSGFLNFALLFPPPPPNSYSSYNIVKMENEMRGAQRSGKCMPGVGQNTGVNAKIMLKCN
jgi:hypothetical protein